ncbi:MAG: hypothetical protein ACXAC8_00700 [Candidatus Hodarchaeales archaeon]
MRNAFVRSSKLLFTVAGLGILIFAIGVLYFTGVAYSIKNGVPARAFYGLDYSLLAVFGFFLALGIFPALSVMDANSKKSIKKLYIHLLLIFAIGLLGLIYSALVYGTHIQKFDPRHSWFDYFILFGLLIIFALIPLLFSIRDRERVWNLKLLFALFIIVGILLEVVSMVVYGQYIPTLNDLGIGWELFFLVGGTILLLGEVPLIFTAGTNFRNFLHRLRLLWILGMLTGFSLILVSFLVYGNMINTEQKFLGIDWFIFLIFGFLLLLSTALFIVASDKARDFIRKLRLLWLLLLFLGIILVLISFVLILPSSPEIAAIVGSFDSSIAGYSWDLFYQYGIILTILSLIFICSILYAETDEFGESVGILDSFEKVPDIQTTPSEMVVYLEILSKTQAAMINQFKEAVREDKFRPRVFESLVKQHRDRNRTIKMKLESFRKKSAGSVFATALGEPSSSAASPFEEILEEDLSLEPSISPSTPAPTAPPVPTPAPPRPASTPSAPPMPPPPPPSSSKPSTPFPAPSAPPAPTTTPRAESVPSSESPLDLIADARSTSIAELRGEMLKELRRLREIFKEE